MTTFTNRLCDVSFEDCRAPLIGLIRNETSGIDAAWWFMEDSRYAVEIIKRHKAGVPVRVIIDPRANITYQHNARMLQMIQDAGIPMRRVNTPAILHWKMMLFDAQNVVEFSGANYSPHAFSPQVAYQNYIDEVIFFASDPSIVDSFRTTYDDLWTDPARTENYANVTDAPVRRYPATAIDPALNFVPKEDFAKRAIACYAAETQGIDVIMYRITDRRHADAMIAAVQRGVPVRLITEQKDYRNPKYIRHSANLDRMYTAGVQIKDRKHLGLNHQKTMLLRNQQSVIFGSSNWSLSSAQAQQEHNLFSNWPWFYEWFTVHFERKWNAVNEFKNFTPLAPGSPKQPQPANGSIGISVALPTLQWEGGSWSYRYDVYFGITSSPPLVASDVKFEANPDQREFWSPPLPLTPNTKYYWKIVGKTEAGVSASSSAWSFTTGS